MSRDRCELYISVDEAQFKLGGCMLCIMDFRDPLYSTAMHCVCSACMVIYVCLILCVRLRKPADHAAYPGNRCLDSQLLNVLLSHREGG